jgi:hypothetical protein
MRFIVNENKKIIFGWSPKCGCTHVKNMVHFLDEMHLSAIHIYEFDTYELPKNLDDYIIIMIIRSPYKRIISGMLDKYKKKGNFRSMWNTNDPLTFKNFVNKTFENNYEIIDLEHFSPQTSGWFIENLKFHKKTIIYDIEHIDYDYIGSLYQKIITQEVIQLRGNHINKNTELLTEYVFDTQIDEYSNYKIPIEYFYNDDLKEKILQIYKDDFEFFESKGFYYSCKQTDDLTRDYSKCLSKINTYASSKYKNLRQRVNE